METFQVVQNYLKVRNGLPKNVNLVVVSKFQSADTIKPLYEAGQRDFGENRVQELLEKRVLLPADIQWHFIGNLQSNKVKYIAPFISLIQSVSSADLFAEIDKHAKKNNRIIDCLIEVHVAAEESKQGFNFEAAEEFLSNFASKSQFKGQELISGASISGLMGMATNTSDSTQIKKEFNRLTTLYEKYKNALGLKHLSMGMSGDYPIAIEEGSNMVRIGSLIFGGRY